MYRIRWWIAVISIFYALIGAPFVNAETEKGENNMTVLEGKKVSIEYTLKLEDKTVLDTNAGSDPLTYVHGSHQIIPGLEKELYGMKVGDSKQVTVKPEEGYGEVNEKAIIEVSKDLIPEEALKVGTPLQGTNDDGQTITATVKEINEKTVVLDHNHPLAGKTLFFDVKIMGIE